MYLAYHLPAIVSCLGLLQVLLGDADLLGKALKALVTPGMLPGFLVTASEFTLNLIILDMHAYDFHTCAVSACLRQLLLCGTHEVLY